MLKKDLEDSLESHKELVTNLRSQRMDLERALEKSNEKTADYIKLQKHRGEALTAIRAIMEVNCKNEQDWQRIAYHVHEQHEREGKEPPTPPKLSNLYIALVHIEEILRKPLSEPELGFSSY